MSHVWEKTKQGGTTMIASKEVSVYKVITMRWNLELGYELFETLELAKQEMRKKEEESDEYTSFKIKGIVMRKEVKDNV
ncbi:gp60 [Listeria phage P40]|uniref:gp60 n=1 Tax=Listeria phage P40 TaxID=560178 RepID=UPI0001819909|nr:gp60 [Listeria phage P40]ACI00420.1 gp60 [Listeria phage P40]